MATKTTNCVEFTRNFDINSRSSQRREEKYLVMLSASLLLNQLFDRNMIHIILHICLFLNWIDISRISELVNFNLMACLQSNRNIMRRIFFINTSYSSNIKKFKYFKLNFYRLTNLAPLELFWEYNIISRFPAYNIFDIITTLTKYSKVTDFQFHPTEQLLAIIFDHNDLYILAYGVGSHFRKGCLNTGILYHCYVPYEYAEVCYGLQWSPQGTFLSFFSNDVVLTNISEWQPRLVLSIPKCSANKQLKKIVVLYLDKKKGTVQSMSDSSNKDFECCKWKQSKYLWKNDTEIIYYKSNTLFLLTFNIQAKTYSITTFLENPLDLFFPIENKTPYCVCSFTGLMIHPHNPETLMMVTNCFNSYHYHHCILFFNITSKKTFYCPINGIISNILFDIKAPKLIVRFYYFDRYYYVPKTTNGSSQSCIYEELPTVSHATMKNRYVNDDRFRADGDGESTKRIQQFFELNITLRRGHNLIHPVFVYYIYFN